MPATSPQVGGLSVILNRFLPDVACDDPLRASETCESREALGTRVSPLGTQGCPQVARRVLHFTVSGERSARPWPRAYDAVS